ncbi:MAG: hypothetical protein KJ871_03780 [Alphaproteobacteria bacterium]|nr:hypothetical protein [Alphaproteobacteria bacterium]MBU2083487.1 hypothetical protein [Alphaproteobacteria bacterium]MBU2143547.1 hypothetical protein [Alphaproteobacteria bacterium]MBU2196052.1 hypothetical protein [Alphaproteobacteria bacterium]
MTTILDPTDERKPVERQISPRNGALTGTIGLLDIRKPRGSVLLDELEQQLAIRLPGITVKRYSKPTFTKPCPDDLRREIASEVDYLVEALAD